MDDRFNSAQKVVTPLSANAARSQAIHERMDAMLKRSADILSSLSCVVDAALGPTPEPVAQSAQDDIEPNSLKTRSHDLDRNLSRIDHLVQRLSAEL